MHRGVPLEVLLPLNMLNFSQVSQITTHNTSLRWPDEWRTLCCFIAGGASEQVTPWQTCTFLSKQSQCSTSAAGNLLGWYKDTSRVSAGACDWSWLADSVCDYFCFTVLVWLELGFAGCSWKRDFNFNESLTWLNNRSDLITVPKRRSREQPAELPPPFTHMTSISQHTHSHTHTWMNHCALRSSLVSDPILYHVDFSRYKMTLEEGNVLLSLMWLLL